MATRRSTGAPAPKWRFGLCLGAVLGGCEGKPATGGGGQEVPSAAAPAVATVKAQAAATDEPRMKPFLPTPEPELGKVAEGLGLEIGSALPDVEVNDVEGSTVSLKTLVRGKRTMIVFYRGGWCPFCNFQIKSLVDDHAEFEKRKIEVVAISVDRPRESAKTKAAHEIPFAVLSDQDLVAHGAFHVVQRVEAAKVAELAAKGMDLEKLSGRTHHQIAVPSVFFIDEQGIVRFVHADPNYRRRPKTRQLLEQADAVFGQG